MGTTCPVKLACASEVVHRAVKELLGAAALQTFWGEHAAGLAPGAIGGAAHTGNVASGDGVWPETVGGKGRRTTRPRTTHEEG